MQQESGVLRKRESLELRGFRGTGAPADEQQVNSLRHHPPVIETPKEEDLWNSDCGDSGKAVGLHLPQMSVMVDGESPLVLRPRRTSHFQHRSTRT